MFFHQFQRFEWVIPILSGLHLDESQSLIESIGPLVIFYHIFHNLLVLLYRPPPNLCTLDEVISIPFIFKLLFFFFCHLCSFCSKFFISVIAFSKLQFQFCHILQLIIFILVVSDLDIAVLNSIHLFVVISFRVWTVKSLSSTLKGFFICFLLFF